MKKIKYITLAVGLLFAAGCEQEVIDLKDPSTPVTPTPTTGTANFTKYVAIGTSISAGYQAGALFTDGQNESMGAILAEQFATVNGNAAFNQPTIGHPNGYNANAGGYGRFILFDPDGNCDECIRTASPAPAGRPSVPAACVGGYEPPAVPAPYNTNQTILQVLAPVTPPASQTFNNFSVPGITLAQILTPATGGPIHNPPMGVNNPAFNPYYRRFASNPSADGATGSTIIADALGAAPTFFTFEFGYNDVLGYATTGGVGTIAITPSANFTGYITTAINTILGSNPNLKGAISNVPDVTKLPFFSLVAWNSIAFTTSPTDVATMAAVNAAYAAYNGGLDAAHAGGAISAAERDKRKITFAAGKNGIVIMDETLTDLTAINPGLVNMRQATSADKITLTAGAILGTRADCNNPSSVYGVGVPLADQYVLLPTEITAIQTAVAAYNTSINNLVTANTTRLALADLNAAYNLLATKGSIKFDGVLLTPSIAPPNAAISEDAVHPNGRGAAYFANVFIGAINTKFGSTIPYANIREYKGTRTPVFGQ